MPVVESRVRKGTLKLGTIDFSCQPTSIKIIPPDQPSGSDDASEVLCGDLLESDSGDDKATWRLGFTAIQDFADPDGLIAYSWENQGTEVPFSWLSKEGGPTFSGNVRVWPLELGGDVGKRLSSDAEWTITSGKPARAEA